MSNEILVRGLLLINAKGEKYFIESGIKPFKEIEIIGELDNDVRPVDLSAIEAQIREEWLEGYEEGEDDTSNVGPFLFQAFNVKIEASDQGSGDATVTGNSTDDSQH